MTFKANPIPQTGDRNMADVARQLDQLKRDITAANTSPPIVTLGPSGSKADYVCDGVRDDIKINAALSACANGAKTLVLFPGTYRVSKQIEHPTGVAVTGYGAKVIVANDFDTKAPYVWGASGSHAGSAIALAYDATTGKTSINVSSSTELASIKPDDYLALISEDLWAPLDTTSSRKRGEFVKVCRVNDASGSGTITGVVGSSCTVTGITAYASDKGGVRITIDGAAAANDGSWPMATYISATSGTFTNAGGVAEAVTWVLRYITIFGMVRDTYATASTAVLYRMAFRENISISGLEITQEASRGDRTDTPQMFGFRKCRGVTLRDLHIHHNDGPGIVFESSIECLVSNCRIHDLWDFSGSATEQYGYGILVGDMAESITVTGTIIDRVRHGCDTGRWHGAGAPLGGYGAARGVNYHGVIVSHATDAAFSSHTESDGVAYIGCVASNCDNYAMFMRGTNSRIQSCTIEWCAGGISIGSTTSTGSYGTAVGNQVVGNVIRKCRNITAGASGIDQTGSGGGGGGGNGIQIGRAENTTVIGNTIEGMERGGFYLRRRCRNNFFANNTIIDCNVANFSGTTGSAIYFGEPLTGTGTTAASIGTSQTITITAGDAADAALVGGFVHINAAAPNGGSFVVTAQTATTITYTNAGGTAVAGLQWESEGAHDNQFQDIFIWNRTVTAQSAERDMGGFMRYAIRIDGAYIGNQNNVFERIQARGMVTGLSVSTSTGTNYFYGLAASPGTNVYAKNGVGADTDYPGSVVTDGTVQINNTGGAESVQIRTAAGWITR